MCELNFYVLFNYMVLNKIPDFPILGIVDQIGKF